MLKKSSFFTLALLSLSAADTDHLHGIITLQNLNLTEHGVFPIEASYTVAEPFHIMGGAESTTTANAIDLMIKGSLTFEATAYLDDLSPAANKTILHINPIDPVSKKAPLGTLINHAKGSNGKGAGFGIGTYISCESGTIINEGAGVEFGHGGEIDLVGAKFINRNGGLLGNQSKVIFLDCSTKNEEDLINQTNGQVGSRATKFLLLNGHMRNDSTMLASDVTLLKKSDVALTNTGQFTIAGNWLAEEGTGIITNNGSIIAEKGEIQINGQSWVNFNAGSEKAVIHAHDVLHFITDGSIINHNSGAVAHSNTGALIEANTSLNVANTCTLSLGDISNLNEGKITGGVGAALSFPKNLILSGTSFSNTNRSKEIHEGIGTLLWVGQDLTLADNTLSFLNAAEATFDPTTGPAIGADFAVDGNMTIQSAGKLLLKNDAPLRSTHKHLSVGTRGTILGNLTMSGGSLALNNTSKTNCIGVKLDVTGAFTMNHSTASSSGFGSQFSAASLSLANSKFTNTDAQVIATTGALVLQEGSSFTNTHTLPDAKSQLLVANGIIIGANAVLTNTSDILVQNNGITMTGGTIRSAGNGAAIRTLGTGGLNFSGGTITIENADGVGSLLSLAGALSSSGASTLHINNTAEISSGIGAQLQCQTGLVAGSTLNLSNTANASDAAGVLATFSNTGPSAFTVSGGAVNIENRANLHEASGAALKIAGTLAMTGGTLTNSHRGISQAASPLPTALVSAGTITIAHAALDNINAQVKTAMNALTLSAGAVVTNTHDAVADRAHCSAVYGSQIASANGFFLGNKAVLNNINTGAVAENFFGSDIAILSGSLQMSGGVLSSSNEAPVSGTGASIRVPSGGFALSGGSVLLKNSGNVSGGIGSLLSIEGALAISGSGALHLSNTAVGSGIGTLLSASSVAMSGGSFEMSNTALTKSGTVGNISGHFVLVGGALTLSSEGTQLNISDDLVMQGGTVKNGGAELHASNILMSQNAVSFVNSLGLVSATHNLTFSAGVYTNESNTIVGNLLTLNGGTLHNQGLFTFHALNMNSGTFYNESRAVMPDNAGPFVLAGGLIHCAKGRLDIGNNDMTVGSRLHITNHFGHGSQLTCRHFTLNTGGTLLLSNDINLGAGVSGEIGGDFLMNGGALSILNTAHLNSSQLQIAGKFIQQTGTVENSRSLFSAASITMQPGAGTFTNKGGLVQSATHFTLEDGTFTNLNERPSNFGTRFVIGTKGVLSGGELINRNTAEVNTSQGGLWGALIQNDGDMTLSGGSRLHITNSGNVSSGNIGSSVVATGNFTLTDGARVNVSNEASDIRGIGAQLVVQKTLRIKGGTLTNQTIGSTIEASKISIEGGVMHNNGEVNAGQIEITGGTLTGHGVINSSVVNTGGIVIPGDLLTINGTYSQSRNGALLIHLSPDGVSNVGNLTVTHAALGGHLILSPLESLVPHGVNQIEIITITEPTGLSGAFSSVTLTDIPGTLSPVIDYGNDDDHAYVRLLFLDPLPPLPPPSAPLVTSYLGGETYQTMFILINRNNFRLEREMQRLRHRFSGRESSKNATQSLAQSSAPASNAIASSQPMLSFFNFEIERKQQELREELSHPQPVRPWNFFCGPTGGTGKVNTQGKQLGAHYWDLGALAGFDYAFSEVGIGLLVDFDRTHVDVEQNWGHYHFEHLHSNFFATYAPDILPELAFNGTVGGAYDWYDIRRNTKTSGTAKGDTRGSEFDSLFAVEYVFSGEQFSTLPKKLELIPRAFLQFIYVDIKKFTEHDAGAAKVHLHSQFGKSLRSGLDLWGKYTWDWKNFAFALEGDIGWQREYFDHGQSIHFTPIGVKGPTTPISTHGAGRDTLTAGLDFFFQFFKKYGVELSYDFQYNRLFHDHALYLGCEVRY